MTLFWTAPPVVYVPAAALSTVGSSAKRAPPARPGDRGAAAEEGWRRMAGAAGVASERVGE